MLRIYHTSDLHDHRGIVAPLRALRASEPGLLFDCGDSLRGSQTVFFGNEPMIGEIDAAGYDAQAMGNREFHYVYSALEHRVRRMGHPLICSNLVDTRDRPVSFVPTLDIDHTDSAGRVWPIRLFGLLVVQYPEGSPWERILGWRFLDPIETARRVAAQTPAGRVLIALSHIGLSLDRVLAKAVPRIDLILGGHSHDTLERPEMEAGVPIVHAGPYGAFVSRSEFEPAEDGRRLTLSRFDLVPLLAP